MAVEDADSVGDKKRPTSPIKELDNAVVADAIRSGISLWSCPTCHAVSPSMRTLSRCTGPQHHLRPLGLASFNLCSAECTDRVERGGAPLSCPRCHKLTEIMTAACPDAYRDPGSGSHNMLAMATGAGGSASATLSEGKVEMNAQAGEGGVAVAHLSGFTGESACVKATGGNSNSSVQVGNVNVKGAVTVVSSGSATMQNIRAESCSVIAGDVPSWMLKLFRGE